MKRLWFVGWLAAVAWAGAGTGPAFDPAHPFAQSKPGDMLKYRIALGDRTGLIRQAVTAKDETRIAIETYSEMKAADRTLHSVIQVVEKLGSREVLEMRMKGEDGAVTDLSGMIPQVSASMRAKDPFAGDRPWVRIGAEPVTVAPGTFACDHYRKAKGENAAEPQLDIWVCNDLPHTGVVRMETGVGMKMELLEFGREAKTEF